MSRRNIENLPMPSKYFRPDRRTENPSGKNRFETKRDAKKEDAYRIKSLQPFLDNSDHLPNGIKKKGIKRLINNIRTASTAASAVYMRGQRIRIAGNIWQTVDEYDGPVSTCTLIPRSCLFAGGQLDKADPTAMIEQLRQALIRDGADKIDGFLVASIHGEHEPSQDHYPLHAHVVVTGGMIQAVDRLRKRRDFRSSRKAENSEDKIQRVRISRKPLADLPDPLTYIVQSYWPAKSRYELRPGEPRRETEKRRIREPHHTEVLLWLDKWPLKSRTLLMGLSVTKSGFKISKKLYTNGGRP